MSGSIEKIIELAYLPSKHNLVKDRITSLAVADQFLRLNGQILARIESLVHIFHKMIGYSFQGR